MSTLAQLIYFVDLHCKNVKENDKIKLLIGK